MNINSPALAAMLRNSRNGLRGPGAVPSARPSRQDRPAKPSRDGRFARWHVPQTIEREPESWLLTYLDLITLLLAMLVVLLAVSRIDPQRYSGADPHTEVALVGTAARGLPEPHSADAGDQAAQWISLSFELPDIAVPQAASTDAGHSAATPIDTATAVPETEPAAVADGGIPPLVPPSIAELGLGDLGDSVDVIINSQSVSFRINNELLFPSGQASLHPDGMAVLKRLATVLNRNDHQVSVEGHSDTVPIKTPLFPSNWELSTARATSVLRQLERDGVSSGRMRAVGYADTRPLEPNTTPQGRAANRRVELIMEITPANSAVAAPAAETGTGSSAPDKPAS